MTVRSRRTVVPAMLALAFGCRDVVGIETRAEGPPMLPLSGACLTCVDAGCDGVERGCAADNDCAEVASCIAQAGLDNPVERTACLDTHPRGAATEAFRALDGCARSTCLDACYGPAGFFAAYGPQCDACTEATCIAEMRDCVADASCERRAVRAYGDPDSLNPASIRPFVLTPGDAGREEREFLDCAGSCPAECGFSGGDFRCVGQFQWPTQIPSTADIEIQVVLIDGNFVASPLPGATVEACSATGTGCDAVETTLADEAGLARLTVKLAGLSGFRGFARITAETADGPTIPSHLVGYPILGDLWSQGYAVTQKQFEASAILLGSPRVDGRAHLLILFNDCASRRAPGMRVELPAGAMDQATTKIYYPESVDDTGDDGWVSIINAMSGCYEIRGRNGEGAETHRMRVRADPDVWTIVLMEPTSDPPDLGYNCEPTFTHE